MKKALLGITTSFFVIASTSCGLYGASIGYNGENDEEIFKYQQYTPSDKIVKGSETAIDTLENYLDVKNIKEKETLATFEMKSDPIYGSDKSKDDFFLVYDVSCFPENTRLFFLYKDDTEIAEAIPGESCISSNGKVYSSHLTNGTYAWLDEEDAFFVIGKDALYRCTSVWCYDEKTNEVERLFEEINCPIWATED